MVINEGPNSKQRRKEVVASLLTRAGRADEESRNIAKTSYYQSMSLMELAKSCLQDAGVDPNSLRTTEIARAALTTSTSDYAVLLENTMHKAMIDAYRSRQDTWRRFCKVGSVNDFRTHHRYRAGSIGSYQTVNENGEIVHASIPDGAKETVAVTGHGLIIPLTYEMIINDDLETFVNTAADLGRAGRRTVEAAVYSLLGENSGLGPTMQDGNPLFHSSHGNVGTGAALSAAAISADYELMASQTDISENEFLDIVPNTLVVPLTLRGTALSINDAEFDPDTGVSENMPNSVRGLFSHVVGTPRLSGTRRYLFADPAEAPVVEVAFLHGADEPYLLMEESFSSRGAKYRGTLDFGVSAIAWEGSVTNAGQ